MYYGSWKIDDYLTFVVNTHKASTGAATDGDGVPIFRIYEDETATPIVTGSMALLDDANTTGFYSERVQLTAGSGFGKGKSYNVYIEVTVNSIVGTISHNFQIEAEVDANTVSGTVATVTSVTNRVTANVDQLDGGAQSLTDLKDFADAGYDPGTNKVQGVVLVDTTTDNSDMVGTDSAALASELAKVPKSDGTTVWNATAQTTIQTKAAAALTAYDSPTKAEMDTAHALLTTPAQVETAVDARLDASNTELASVPTTAGSLRKMLQFIFTWARDEETVTSTTKSLKKEDGTQLGSSALSDDGTTFTRGKMS